MNKLIVSYRKFLSKMFLCFFLTASSFASEGQTHSLQKIWETGPVVAIPESVLPSLQHNVLYISLINGAPWDADGKGGVGKLGMDGKNYDSTFITGLNAPKGMGLYGNKLYVADISDVVVVDINQGKIEKKIPIENGEGLNDITIDMNGVVYVSDSKQGKIWRIENEQPALFLDKVDGVNGLKMIGYDLYIGAGKDFIKADKDKNITKIATLPQGIDGIEPVENNDFVVTSWAGYIYYIGSDGHVQTILDVHDSMNTADIGYYQEKRILYVPTFNAKKIIAYRLK